jgi:sulfite reductase (NADPH) flavoprotein alpha-component
MQQYMLADNKFKLFLDLLNTSSKEELIWMNGYLNGVVKTQSSVAPVAAAVNKITIVYGTETGNSKRLATDFAAKAKQSRIHAKVVGMDQYQRRVFISHCKHSR